MDALLLLVPLARAGNHRGRGDFHMDRHRPAAAPQEGQGRALRLHRHPDGLEAAARGDAPEGPFSTNILWDRAIEEGRCFGAVHQGLWFDVGTPQVDPMTERRCSEAPDQADARRPGSVYRSRAPHASPMRSPAG